MENLGKIFGSNDRVKIMRMFLFNEASSFDIDDVAERSMIKSAEARKELSLLLKIGFLKKKTFTKKIAKKPTKKNPKPGFKSVKKNGWVLNHKFSLVKPLHTLLTDSDLIDEKGLVSSFRKAGNIKLIALSGLFMRDFDRKLDLLIIGDKMKRNQLDKEIKKIESEVGRELSYALFSSDEFAYRMSMYDKLIRDVLENKHKTLVNKIL